MAQDQNQDGITAYHGSPHEFEQFDTSKIGTGEGAQAYGHGLYFAESEPIARSYRDQLSGFSYRLKDTKENIAKKFGQDVADIFEQSMGNRGEISNTLGRLQNNVTRGLHDAGVSKISDLNDSHNPMFVKDLKDTHDRAERLASLLRSGDIEPHQGHMYEVNINAHPDHFLDWDKPLSQQSEHVKNALQRIGIGIPKIAPLPSDPAIRYIVKKSLAQSGNNPEDVGLMVDNDYQLYKKAQEHAASRGINLDDMGIGEGEYVEKNAKEYLDSLIANKKATGENVLRNLVEKTQNSPELVSKLLHQNGVRGVKYFDASSRGKGEGSRNYVVFDHNDVDIKRRYEQGGAVDEYPLAENAEDHFKEMPPQDFLDQTRPLKGTAEDKKIIQEFKKDIKKGEKLDPLALYKSGKENGRHRATAAKELGIKKVPVHDYRKRDGGAIVKHALMVISKKA